MLYNSLKDDFSCYDAILEQIIENMPLPISVVDCYERFTMLNHSYERVFDIKREFLLGKHYSCHVGDDDKSIHKIVLKTKRYYSGTKVMGQDRRLVQIEGFPVLIDGQLVCSIAVIHEHSSVEKAMAALNEARQLIREAGKQKAHYSFDDILHQSACMKQAISRAKNAASTDVTVLLRGESGTGKELFAHAIHNASARSRQRFISVNCSSLPDNLLESILFGYAGHAFTGAKKEGEIGLFEAADHGTIFLDEIGDISASLQLSLLRVLQEREITRVGDTLTKPVDVRVIAATNADLERRIAAGSFRRDLYYRLNVLPVSIPPLRERTEDIRILTEQFLHRYSREYGRDISSITEKGMAALLRCSWDGNVRELENVIARSVLEAPPGLAVLHETDLMLSSVQSEEYATGSGAASVEKPYDQLFSAWESGLMQCVYEQEGHNKTKTARRLGISVRSVYQKLKTYGID